MSKTIVGLFDTFAHAQSAVNDLISAGFSRDDINIVANNAAGEFGTHEVTTGGVSVGHAAGDAVKGAAKGALYGGLTGLAASIALALIPGVGPIAAAGAIAATIGGAGLGATAGGVIGGLTGLGIPDEDAHYYAEGIRRGGTLVTVLADETRAQEAIDILNRHNPADIEDRASYYKTSGYTGRYDDSLPTYTPEQITEERTRYSTYTPPVAASTWNTASTATTTPVATDTIATNNFATTDRTINSGEQVNVPIIEEQIAVGKRAVERGGARIHTRVIEQPVTESVTLREEHVTVDRHAVNRPASTADLNNAFQEGTIEVTSRNEVPVVSKDARVVEEVTIGKQASERTETISDTVRRTEVDVDELNEDEDLTTPRTTTTTGSRF